MKELFNNIISVQLGASIAIVLLLLSRSIMKKRYVAKLRYWLWLVIALRLCLPVDINIQLNRTATVNIPVNDYYITSQQSAQAGQPTEFEIITADQLNLQPVTDTHSVADIPPVIKTVSVTDILYKIWLIVAVLLVQMSFVSYFLAKKDIMSTAYYSDKLLSDMENLKKQMGINKRVRIALCHYTGSPMLVGLLNPIILIPREDYTPVQLEMVIRHELTHLKRNDVLYKLLLHTVACVYWFNPLTACMARLAGKDIEISCDEDVVKTGDKQFKADYAQTIIRVISMQNNKLILATNFSQNVKTVKERFTNIFTDRRLKAGKSVLAVFMAVVIGATSLVGCTYKPIIADDNKYAPEITEATDIGAKLENSYLLTINEQQMISDKFYLDYVKSDGTKYGAKFTVSIDANGNLKYLCNKNCSHTDNSCNAYRSEYNFYFTYNGNTYAIARKEDRSFTPYREIFQLFKITSDGAEIISSMPEYHLNELEMIVYEDNIYFQARDWDTNTYRIMKMNLHNGEYTVIADMPEGIYATLLLAMTDKNYFVFNGSYDNTPGVYAVKIDNGSIVKVADSIMNEYSKFNDDTIYKIDRESKIFYTQRLGEAPEELINLGEYTDKNINSIYKILDDNAVIVFDDGTYIVYDVNSKKISDKKIVKLSNNNFCEVEADFGHIYLIKTKVTGMNAELSLINKEDYLSGNARIYPVITCEYGY